MTYFPTEKLLKNISVRPWVFGDYVFSNIAIDMMKVRSSPFYETKLNRVGDRREKLFFDFSVRMGAMITYVLMQAMNSDTIKQLTLGETVDKDTNYLVEEWIKMVVNPLKMLRQLHRTIGANKFDIFSNKDNLFAKRNTKLSSDVSIYQLKDESFKQYIQAFAGLYPDVYDKLEKIRESLDKKIKLENDWFEQIKCKHDEFTVVFKKKTVSEKEISVKMFRCHKCSKQISIAVHNIITDKRLVEVLDKLKPPESKYCHQWTLVVPDNLAFYHFVCPLCERLVRLAARR